MEELKHRLEALAKKIALKEAEILDLRNEVQTLRALMNTIIDEQIRIEEDAAKRAAEQAAAEKAAQAARAALDEQKQKETEAEEARLAAEHEAKLLEEEARVAQAKAMEELRVAQEEAEKQALEQAEAKEQAEANARAEAEAAAARVAELERLRAEEEAKRLADQQAAREKAEKEAEEKEKAEAEAIAAEKAKEEANQRVPEQDHEAIMRTIENMANGVNIKPSRADRFQDKQTLGDKVSRSRLHDIKKAIGLNEKFLYANELFNGDMSAFSQAVDELNHVESEHDANRIIQEELADKYHWDEEDETVIAFKSLVSRRFV